MYQQPDFYSFSEDSVFLAKFAADFCLQNNLNIKNAIDLGAGCGVVGIEFFLSYPFLKSIQFVEKQEKFSSFLHENCSSFLKDKADYKIIIDEIENFSIQDIDLILMNPPYFLEGTHRVSPHPEKALCRSISLVGLKAIFESIFSQMNTQSYFIFCSPKNWKNLLAQDIKKKGIKIIKTREEFGRLFWIMKLDVDRN